MGYGLCPKCGSDSPPGTTRERCLDGKTRGDCGESTPSRDWEPAVQPPPHEHAFGLVPGLGSLCACGYRTDPETGKTLPKVTITVGGAKLRR